MVPPLFFLKGNSMTYARHVTLIILCSFIMTTSVLVPYEKAYAAAVPIAYSTWEVLVTILLSLGISVELTDDVADTGIMQEMAQEFEDTINLWWQSNNFDNLEIDLKNMASAAKDGTVNIANDVWQGLREWGKSVVPNIQVSEGNLTNTKLSSFMGITSYVSGYDSSSLATRASEYMSYPGTMITKMDAGSFYEYYFFSVLNPSLMSLKQVRGETKTFCEFNYDGVKIRVGNVNLAGKGGCRVLVDKKGQCIGIYDMQSGGILGNLFDTAVMMGNKVSAYDALPVPQTGLGYDVLGLPDIDRLFERDAYDIITPGRVWDGTAVGGDVTLDIPSDTTLEGLRAGDIPYPDVLDEIGVIPVDTTKDKAVDKDLTIEEAINSANEKEDNKDDTDDTGGGGSSNVPITFDLTKLFPFCIPFDMIEFIGILAAEPVAPHFEIPIMYPSPSGLSTYMLVIDFSDYESVAVILRKMECILFIIGLAKITRGQMIRG